MPARPLPVRPDQEQLHRQALEQSNSGNSAGARRTLEDLIASFRNAASLARQAGFDGVEVHGANHYAVHQFFSPRANRDGWECRCSCRERPSSRGCCW